MLLAKSVFEQVLQYAMSKGADFAEVFVEKNYSQRMNFISKEIESSSANLDFGIGIRLFFGHEIVYGTSNFKELSVLQRLIDDMVYSLGTKKDVAAPLVKKEFKTDLVSLKVMPWDFDLKNRIELIKNIDRFSRESSPLISQVEVNLSQSIQEITIANSEGLLVEDIRPYSSIYVQSIAQEGSKKELGAERAAFMMGSEFLQNFDAKSFAQTSSSLALELLKASPAPAGNFPVVLNNGFGGVIFHEACGHGLETTSVATGASVFCGKLNQKIASEELTAIDNGQMKNMWGSIEVDDEGTQTQNTSLIENGVLKSYLVDKMGSLKTGYKMTGSARRESYHYAPTSRMRNTYIAAGKHSFEDLISDIEYGIFAEKLGGGSVDTGTGAYNFSVKLGRIIRDGKLAESVKGASLIGTGFDTLSKITKVGKDLELAPGTCGSISGSIPVTVGQPQLLVSEITVGGQSA